MNISRPAIFIAFLSFVLVITSAQSPAQAATAAHKKHASPSKQPRTSVGELADEVRALREQMEQQRQQLLAEQQRQQQQIDLLQQQLQQAQIANAQAQQAKTQAEAAQQQTASVQQSLATVQQDVASQQKTVAATTTEVREIHKAIDSPASWRYKGMTITPGGFIEAASVWRQHGMSADIDTPFNAIPYPGAAAYNTSDFFGSARQSRLTLLAEGKIKNATFRGYYETDWLSAGTTSNNNQSNSYTNRQRQLFAQVAFNDGWQLTGGQMWSLVTETKKGLDNRTEALPMTIDPQYHVGFSWARQYGFRAVKDFGDKFWIGAAIENPQATVATHGNAANFFLGGPGNGAGLYNPTANYSFNPSPDIIVKAAAEPGIGHYELFGILSRFRDRIYPDATAATPSVAGAHNDSRSGGGIGANARISFAKRFDLGTHFLGGRGVGRYGTSSLADSTVRPDGTLAMLTSYQALGTFEVHTKMWDWYFNAGAEYAGRDSYLNAAGKPVGYGSPLFSNVGCTTETLPGPGGFAPGAVANCNADTRDVIEGTFGFWFKPYSGEKGRIQFGPQYSYIVRNSWNGIGGAPGTSQNMLMTSFRYYIP